MSYPARQGLYDPAFEHDACGLGFVATLRREATHDIVRQALEILGNLTHRGAAGSDPNTGDGAGILLQIPHALYADDLASRGIELPPPGDYAVATCFFANRPSRRRQLEAILEEAVVHHGQRVLGWRDVPIDPAALGPIARDARPSIRQLFIGRTAPKQAFDATLYTIRKRAGRSADSDDFYITSCSSKTVVYKGLMLAEQVAAFYPDLQDPRCVSLLALVHSRFSTNTFPAWERAHPYRLIAHNGEINTVRGNIAWMQAREALLKSSYFDDKMLEDFKPIVRSGGSDSASLDNVVDFLLASGRSLPHVMMMLVPEAWALDPDMSAEKKAFYEYHGCLVEPWDGPAALCFTDGQLIGATLDRNGLRPAKWLVTSDGLVVLASEFGVLDIHPSRVTQKGRLQPGKMFLVDTAAGRVVSDEEIKHSVATQKPYGAWVAENKIDLRALENVPSLYTLSPTELPRLEQAFGYTEEDLRTLLAPMATEGAEPIGSMGVDIPLAALSHKPQLLFRYFKQHFAQVTNPPIDPLREAIVMSLVSCVGGEGNLLEETPRQCRMLELPHPILTQDDLSKLRKNVAYDFRTATLPMHFSPDEDPEAGLRTALERLCRDAARAIADGASILILSDRGTDERHVPIPSLLATGAVHHHLIREGLRARAGIIVETGEAREVAHMALLVGYGAGAISPYLAFESIAAMVRDKQLGELTVQQASAKYVKALCKGILKVMSKMGISTLSSYQGAQIFEAIGIDQMLIDRYFTGTASRIRGIGLADIAEEAIERHAKAFGRVADRQLDVGGHHHWRITGEKHLWSPDTVAALQKAVRLDDVRSYEDYAKLINDQGPLPMNLRGLWDLLPAGRALPIDEVEPAKEIVKRFVTGAMSFGSISKEAHENLAIAMNRIGGKSNTGEGGEDPERFHPDPTGDLRRSAVKQVASGRFGVTAEYLVNADELQIKMAQGAKPGEGGQLPGHKVDAIIAKVRHSTPGVTLISPPPHHDIYSIEDLAQLIFDLKNVNPRARISVKLVAEAGVGTIAAGVVKALADAVLISGDSGGTGASPLTSIHHAGVPWELGLAEAHQVLVMNGLRGRAALQVDGKLMTGRDVAVAALLGAEEFGFATAPLVASGCIMMRKCHLNTCPTGIATQDPELRKKFTGQPEHVVRFFFYVAEELRRIMASLGFAKLTDMIGRSDLLAMRKDLHPRARKIDCSEILYRPKEVATTPNHCCEPQNHKLAGVKDYGLVAKARPAIEGQGSVSIETTIKNSDRAFGAMLSGEIARRYGDVGLPEDTIRIRAVGSAGQSFGAFASRGTTLELEGDANDYVGKALSGGIVVVKPPAEAPFRADDQVIVGNVVLYGATSGRAFFNGRAGERFAVRNSGATAVIEGIGDHGCEYMTGGVVVVLGTTGRNFGAGMSGGLAYVFDEDAQFSARCNKDMVGLEVMTEGDAGDVRALLEEHARRTGSRKATELLERWEAVVSKFVKVVPTDYRRALEVSGAVMAGVSARLLPPSAPYVPTGKYVPAERTAAHG